MALEAGVDPEAFWRLTPWMAYQAAAAGHARATTLAWTIAALERQKKLPRLETLVQRQGPRRQRRSDDELKAFLMSQTARGKRHGR